MVWLVTMTSYKIIEPNVKKIPIIISIPHCGTEFPPECIDNFDSQVVSSPDDTDWYVDRLYDFAFELGITIIQARYSRYIIDLNRSIDDIPLYYDGRTLTGLFPEKTLSGKNIYRSFYTLSQKEKTHRKNLYYLPYYQKITEHIQNLQKEFRNILLFDAHSINHFVPAIQSTPFPNLILGDVNETSAHTEIIQTALSALNRQKTLSVSHNDPFKGGNITRYFGKPSHKAHALQLEMTQNNYMNEEIFLYQPDKAEYIRNILKNMFVSLDQTLRKLS